MGSTNRWAIILAGGDGKRLERFTELLHGDKRPKQFSILVGNRTLLGLTYDRAARMVSSERIILLLTRQHEEFYGPELESLAGARALIQPRNRGTAPAIYWGIVEASEADPDSTVIILPSDHFYSREDTFLDSLDSAIRESESKGRVVLLGAEPTGPETSYGWIEIGQHPDRACRTAAVAGLWEKPEANEAARLFHRGCLWSTFVMVGPAKAFLRLVRRTVPELPRSLYRNLSAENRIEAAYDNLRPIDFSREVLQPVHRDLLVLPMGDAGWSDLGEPPRALDVVSKYGTNTQRSLVAALGARG